MNQIELTLKNIQTRLNNYSNFLRIDENQLQIIAQEILSINNIELLDIEKDYIFDNYRIIISKLNKIFIDPKYKNIIINGTNIQILNLKNIINKISNIKNNSEKLLNFINNIFTEFMSGITYFSTNTNVSRPIYHREQSCGQKDELHDLDCSTTNDENILYKRRNKVWKCYLERLVYDKIFNHYTPLCEQDYKHRNFLINTARGINKFNSCFKETTMDIKISWTQDNIFPKILEIITINSSKQRKEIYIKDLNNYNKFIFDWTKITNLETNISSIYKLDVFCERKSIDKETKVVIENKKTQSFSKFVNWTTEIFKTLPIKKGGNKNKTSSKFLYNGKIKNIYLGPRGGKYIKDKNQFIRIKKTS